MSRKKTSHEDTKARRGEKEASREPRRTASQKTRSGSKIEELITQFCPQRVRFVAVGGFASYTRGVTYDKNDERQDGQFSVLVSGTFQLAQANVVQDQEVAMTDCFDLLLVALEIFDRLFCQPGLYLLA